MNKIQYIKENFETILPEDIRYQLNDDLTSALKSIIEQKGLVRSGFLLDITEVSVSVNKTLGLFRVNIQSSSYLKYLDEKYMITQSFINHPSYRNALKLFKELSNGKYDEYIKINKELKNSYV